MDPYGHFYKTYFTRVVKSSSVTNTDMNMIKT